MSGRAAPAAGLATAIGQLSEYAATLSWDARHPGVRDAVRRVPGAVTVAGPAALALRLLTVAGNVGLIRAGLIRAGLTGRR